jgi:hypothetical protein
MAGAIALASPAQAIAGTTYHVSARGSDTARGTSPREPIGSIQKALERAVPGDVIELAPGRYLQDVKTVRDGLAGKPITIRGPVEAVVSGAGAPRVFEVNHDYIELHGFTLDGKVAAADRKDSYRDKLLYVIGTKPGDGVIGLKVLRMTFRNAGGECLRMRYFAQRNEVAHSRFDTCGVHDYRFSGGGKNGEAIYIGTAPEQLGERGAPDRSVDQSNENRIHHNTINTKGNECVDIKEGSSGNIVEHNACTGQRDKNSAGLDSRGSGNVFRYNTVSGSAGGGVRLGGDSEADGINNEVYGNRLIDNEAGGVVVRRGPQGKICENQVSGSPQAAIGSLAKDLDPTGRCSDAVLVTGQDKPSRDEASEVKKPSPEKNSESSSFKVAKTAPPLRCATAEVQCVVAKIEGDERDQIKIIDASDTKLRGRHLVLLGSTLATGSADPKTLAGKVVRIEFGGLSQKNLQAARIIEVMN